MDPLAPRRTQILEVSKVPDGQKHSSWFALIKRKEMKECLVIKLREGRNEGRSDGQIAMQIFL